MLSKTLLGSVAGLDTNETATINAGFGSRDLTAPREGNTFALRGLISGPQDVLAARSTSVNGVLALTRVILRRAPELPDSTTIPVLDFNSPESFAPVVANVTVNGITAEGAASDTRLHTAYSESILTFLTGSARTATRPYYAIPEARLRAGDLQVLSVTANPTRFAARPCISGRQLIKHSPSELRLNRRRSRYSQRRRRCGCAPGSRPRATTIA